MRVKVKTFSEESFKVLEGEVNGLLDWPNIEVIDIKFATSSHKSGCIVYSAMVIYKS